MILTSTLDRVMPH